MTDEEKAKKYVEETVCSNMEINEFCENESCKKCIAKISYIYGLNEGRKEVREHETTCINRLHYIEKENAELKNQIEKQKSINKDYVDEVYNYQKELEECEIEYQSLVDFVDEKDPALLQEYAIQSLRSQGAIVIKLKGGD